MKGNKAVAGCVSCDNFRRSNANYTINGNRFSYLCERINEHTNRNHAPLSCVNFNHVRINSTLPWMWLNSLSIIFSFTFLSFAVDVTTEQIYQHHPTSILRFIIFMKLFDSAEAPSISIPTWESTSFSKQIQNSKNSDCISNIHSTACNIKLKCASFDAAQTFIHRYMSIDIEHFINRFFGTTNSSIEYRTWIFYFQKMQNELKKIEINLCSRQLNLSSNWISNVRIEWTWFLFVCFNSLGNLIRWDLVGEKVARNTPKPTGCMYKSTLFWRPQEISLQRTIMNEFYFLTHIMYMHIVWIVDYELYLERWATYRYNNCMSVYESCVCLYTHTPR